MSDEVFKFAHSRRMLHKQNAVERNKKIMKAYGLEVTEPHKFHKQSPLNCGQARCVMCGNPRRIFGEKTIQEQSIEQRQLYREDDEYDEYLPPERDAA